MKTDRRRPTLHFEVSGFERPQHRTFPPGTAALSTSSPSTTRSTDTGIGSCVGTSSRLELDLDRRRVGQELQAGAGHERGQHVHAGKDDVAPRPTGG